MDKYTNIFFQIFDIWIVLIGFFVLLYYYLAKNFSIKPSSKKILNILLFIVTIFYFIKQSLESNLLFIILPIFLTIFLIYNIIKFFQAKKVERVVLENLNRVNAYYKHTEKVDDKEVTRILLINSKYARNGMLNSVVSYYKEKNIIES